MMLLEFSLAVAIALSVATAGVGWWFSRTERLDLWSELESDVQNGRVPTEEGLNAMMTIFGGWALIVPGLLTDLLGASLLFPAVRKRCIHPLRSFIRNYLL